MASLEKTVDKYGAQSRSYIRVTHQDRKWNGFRNSLIQEKPQGIFYNHAYDSINFVFIVSDWQVQLFTNKFMANFSWGGIWD